MPKSDQPNLIEIKVNVPAALLKQALDMFDAMGLKPGDAHRDVWMQGVFKMAEDYNQVLMSEKLRRQISRDES